jgi:hypothetical protein
MQMTSPTPHSDTFYAAVADMAEAVRHKIVTLVNGGRFEYVQRLVAESEIAFGVWPDPHGTGGFGFHLIKGRQHLVALLEVELPNEMTTTAIPCLGREQALAAEHVWGTPDPNRARLETTPQKKRQKAKPRPKERRTANDSSAAPKKARRPRH